MRPVDLATETGGGGVVGTQGLRRKPFSFALSPKSPSGGREVLWDSVIVIGQGRGACTPVRTRAGEIPPPPPNMGRERETGRDREKERGGALY